MINFCDVQELTRNITSYPITVADVKDYSKYYRKTSDNTKDDFIEKLIAQAVLNWENEVGFLLLDQTFKTSLYNQREIYQGFKGRLTRLNIRSFGNVLYHPCNWNEVDAKQILSTDLYFWKTESGTTPATFQLKSGVPYLELFEVYNNLEVTITGGYALNNFTTMPQDIKNCLIMQVANLFDADNNEGCGDGFYAYEVNRIYSKYKPYTLTISI